MMESSCVPPGFRFHPTDEELVGYYLKKKVAAQKIDLDVIRDIDLYRIEPWDLIERCRIGYEEQSEWYFFSHKDKKYPTGTRTNRATLAGFWKATGRDKAVYDKTKLIGMRKTLVFYKGRAPNGQKSDWIMHEYRLETDENGPPQEEGWVVCRAFKKKTTVQSSNNNNKANNMQGGGSSCSWDSPYNFYEEASAVNSVMIDPAADLHHSPYQLLPRHPSAPAPPTFLQSSQNTMTALLSKQEILIDRATNNNSSNNNSSSIFMHPEDDHPFLQLPQLESPSLPSLKRPTNSMMSSLSGALFSSDHPSKKISRSSNSKDQENITDWRALDKFVASQLSHGAEQYQQPDHHRIPSSSFGASHNDQGIITNNSLDMALLLLQGNVRDGGGEEDEEEDGDKLISGFLAASTSTTSESDFGICVFHK